ncbi:MAG: DciA family protein [Pseudomonadota bacterium]
MATAIGKHVDKLTRGAFGAHGFAYAQILTHWETIVGPQLAEFIQPERLRWPAGQERIRHERRRLGGTLTVRVEGPAAIELQHESPHVIERLNTYYGYQAVTAIKIVQGPINRALTTGERRSVGPLPAAQEADLQRDVDHVEDEHLRQALVRLGRGALAAKSKRRKA